MTSVFFFFYKWVIELFIEPICAGTKQLMVFMSNSSHWIDSQTKDFLKYECIQFEQLFIENCLQYAYSLTPSVMSNESFSDWPQHEEYPRAHLSPNWPLFHTGHRPVVSITSTCSFQKQGYCSNIQSLLVCQHYHPPFPLAQSCIAQPLNIKHMRLPWHV